MVFSWSIMNLGINAKHNLLDIFCKSVDLLPLSINDEVGITMKKAPFQNTYMPFLFLLYIYFLSVTFIIIMLILWKLRSKDFSLAQQQPSYQKNKEMYEYEVFALAPSTEGDDGKRGGGRGGRCLTSLKLVLVNSSRHWCFIKLTLHQNNTKIRSDCSEEFQIVASLKIWFRQSVALNEQIFDEFRHVSFYDNFGKFSDLLEHSQTFGIIPASNFMFKVNNENTKTRCEICSKLTLNIFHTLF